MGEKNSKETPPPPLEDDDGYAIPPTPRSRANSEDISVPDAPRLDPVHHLYEPLISPRNLRSSSITLPPGTPLCIPSHRIPSQYSSMAMNIVSAIVNQFSRGCHRSPTDIGLSTIDAVLRDLIVTRQQDIGEDAQAALLEALEIFRLYMSEQINLEEASEQISRCRNRIGSNRSQYTAGLSVAMQSVINPYRSNLHSVLQPFPCIGGMVGGAALYVFMD